MMPKVPNKGSALQFDEKNVIFFPISQGNILAEDWKIVLGCLWKSEKLPSTLVK